MNYLSSKVWANWYKPMPLPRWLNPSGTPRPWYWYHYVFESPISAHALEALWGFALALVITRNVTQSCILSVVLAAKGQTQKADALIPMEKYNMQNVIWRTVYVAVVMFIIWMIL